MDPMNVQKVPWHWRVLLAAGALVLGVVLLAGAAVLLPSPHPANEADAVRFKKHVLTQDFISEGVAVADVNKDERADVVAGPYWFKAPGWTPHEISAPQTFSPAEEYSNSFPNFPLDVNLDGWMDVIRIGFPGEAAYWYENPQGKEHHWEAHLIHPSVNNESPRFVDVDGDGRKDLLFADGETSQMVWLQASTTPGEAAWQRFPISEEGAPGTDRFSHGLGGGDVNGDGRKDVIIPAGWWEAPSDPRSPDWTFHEANLGPAQAQMHAYDFDEDGDKDVVASSAHDYGVWWYEQERSEEGDRVWTQHLIYEGFSQSHGLALADINADGLPDLVTGKRHFAHNGKDPGGHDPAVLYWFELTRGEQGEPSWIPHQIDDESGAGLHLVVRDVTGDGLLDIATANKKGVFLFEQIAP